MARTAVGVTGYRMVGPYFVPPQPAGGRLYWRHVHRPLRRRGAVLARLAAWWPQPALLRRPQCELAWAAEVEQRLRERLGGGWHCVWRPVGPGVSRAALGWIGRGGELVAMARVAFGEQREFLRREQRSLEFLAQVPGTAHCTPRLLWNDEQGERLLLVESVCRGQPCTLATLPRQDLCAAAAWLARFQTHTACAAEGPALWLWRDTLRDAITRHQGLLPAVRLRLLRRLGEVAVPRLTAAHGDFWWGNLLWAGQPPLAVVDWTEFRRREHPMHDPCFFLLTLGRDLLPNHMRTSPGIWLERAFGPGMPFRAWARRWFEHYRWDLGWDAEFDGLMAYLPVAMARYACFGQQAAAWTAACNSGAWG